MLKLFIVSLIVVISGCALLKEGGGRCDVLEFKMYAADGTYVKTRNIPYCMDKK